MTFMPLLPAAFFLLPVFLELLVRDFLKPPLEGGAFAAVFDVYKVYFFWNLKLYYFHVKHPPIYICVFYLRYTNTISKL